MSRIGKKPINIPPKVQVSVEGRVLKAKGPKGELFMKLPDQIDLNIDNNIITFVRPNDEKKVKSLHGLSRALAANVIEGVVNGYSKTLQIIGVGYKAEMKGKRLILALGYSHQIMVVPPEGIDISSPSPNTIIVNGIDKQLVGQTAAVIRDLRPPEPYKGKGIRYENEYVRHKAGKTTAK
ncbi:MAG: 50S ribosomal protein L6 [Ignavibacteria bacterium GWB2_35_12]|nr:MAG: 50S ribosomal protein L6 [Ignavibacteria bacterium GWA2_35_8]OGU39773.1 MAG: 50S ribosomal protein L6 [Ignavibacteria bacterium GWB2_35_12]OGU95544.1 MAG: 50S ribosomal protein L6 [Ignavibacteria bacterium RIFOXYA2_FULL_35_10]OGV21336.1 MAG: 50S ribosomal protein L6 [Ignavibacteria bacterium RIFOXYC2_FULL_35_21]